MQIVTKWNISTPLERIIIDITVTFSTSHGGDVRDAFESRWFHILVTIGSCLLELTTKIQITNLNINISLQYIMINFLDEFCSFKFNI